MPASAADKVFTGQAKKEIPGMSVVEEDRHDSRLSNLKKSKDGGLESPGEVRVIDSSPDLSRENAASAFTKKEAPEAMKIEENLRKVQTSNTSKLGQDEIRKAARSPLKNKHISEEVGKSKHSRSKGATTPETKAESDKDLFMRLRPQIEALIDEKRPKKGSPKKNNSVVPLDDELNIDMSRFVCNIEGAKFGSNSPPQLSHKKLNSISGDIISSPKADPPRRSGSRYKNHRELRRVSRLAARL